MLYKKSVGRITGSLGLITQLTSRRVVKTDRTVKAIKQKDAPVVSAVVSFRDLVLDVTRAV